MGFTVGRGEVKHYNHVPLYIPFIIIASAKKGKSFQRQKKLLHFDLRLQIVCTDKFVCNKTRNLH